MTQDEIIEEDRTKLRPFFSHRFFFSTTEQLPYLKGFGLDYSPKEYYWDAKERQDSFVVFQYTLSGTGYLAKLPNQFTYYRGEEEWSFVYIEFSKEFLQWLSLPIQIGICSKERVEQMLVQLNKLVIEEPSLYVNSRCAYDLFLAIKEVLLTKTATTEQIKDYLETHYKDSLSLDDLEETFQISKYKIIRAFEKEYQQTPINYLNNYRMIQSLRYLQEEMTVKEIAEAVGFSDYNYFSRVFKRIMGFTPSRYRKEILGKL
jgi:AraC-like DNA-binding protein